jgi:PAS domain-containing protein
MLRAVLLLAGWVVANERRTRHRHELKECEAKFRTLLQNAPEAIVILDVEAGRFTEVNDRAVRLFGYSRDVLLTMGPSDVSPAILPTGESAKESAKP